jgi:hypothetical protein
MSGAIAVLQLQKLSESHRLEDLLVVDLERNLEQSLSVGRISRPEFSIKTGSNLPSNTQLVKRMNLASMILGRAEKRTISNLLLQRVTE